MGYRSEVAFAVHPDKVSEFLAALSASPEALQLCQGHPGYDKGIQTDMFEKGDIFIEMSGVKWYEGYKGVDAIDEFIRKVIEDDDQPDKVRFLRVGEDREDIVECGEYMWDDLNIVPASINWTIPVGKLK